MPPKKSAQKDYLTFDIGGTTIKYGLITESAEFLFKEEIPTQRKLGGPNILDKVCQVIKDCRETHPISGVCISTAGMVDPIKGEIFHSAPIIPDYAGTQFKKTIESCFALPCEVENDVNCAALAEAIAGAAKGANSAVMLTVGTGIGGAVILDGKVFHGSSNSAGEIGYMFLPEGEFQKHAATSVLVKTVAKKKGEPSQKWDGKTIFKAAKERDAVCINAIDAMVDVLGKGIANICYVLNPEVVVLGGGVMAQQDYLKPKLQNVLKTYLIPTLYENTSLKFAEFQNDAGMIGALYNFLQKFQAHSSL